MKKIIAMIGIFTATFLGQDLALAVSGKYFSCHLFDPSRKDGMDAVFRKEGEAQALEVKSKQYRLRGTIDENGQYISLSITNQESQLRVSTSGAVQGDGVGLNIETGDGNLYGSCEVTTNEQMALYIKNSSSYFIKIKYEAEKK